MNDAWRERISLRVSGWTKYAVIVSGGFAGYILRAFQEHPAFPATALIGPGVTLLVGYQIQSVLRRQIELSKIPMDAVGSVCKRLETLAANCIDLARKDPNGPVFSAELQTLANEVTWLSRFGRTLKCEETICKLIENAQVDFMMSFRDEFDQLASERTAQRLRARLLVVQASIAHRLLEASADPERLKKLLAEFEDCI